MAWFYILAAGLCEVGWAIALKASVGFSRPVPTTIAIVGMLLSFVLLAQGMKSLPVGTAYTVWTGIGAIGSVMIGIFYFDESRDGTRLFFIGMILVGMLGLKFLAKD